MTNNIEHLMSNTHQLSLLEMFALALALAVAITVFSENTLEKGSTE